MRLSVHAKSYNAYGGNPHLYPIGGFLSSAMTDCGESVEEIDVMLVLPDRGPPKKTLESMFETHQRYRGTLPKVIFHRKKKRFEIAIASEAMDGQDWVPGQKASLPIFLRGLHEVVDCLKLIQKRLKPSDTFDLNKLLSHCDLAKATSPDNDSALSLMIAELRASDEKRRSGMSPWEKLGIDWEDFHPNAKTILDDPFFWDCTDDFSPNGNDTGADLLEGYCGWLKKHKEGHPVKFIEALAKRWGYNGPTDMDEETRGEANIALAFADIKLRGCCDAQARQIALDAVKNQRRIANEATDWPHRQERLKALYLIEAKLITLAGV